MLFLLCIYLGCGFKLLVSVETEKATDEGKTHHVLDFFVIWGSRWRNVWVSFRLGMAAYKPCPSSSMSGLLALGWVLCFWSWEQSFCFFVLSLNDITKFKKLFNIVDVSLCNPIEKWWLILKAALFNTKNHRQVYILCPHRTPSSPSHPPHTALAIHSFGKGWTLEWDWFQMPLVNHDLGQVLTFLCLSFLISKEEHSIYLVGFFVRINVLRVVLGIVHYASVGYRYYYYFFFICPLTNGILSCPYF